MSVPPLDRRNGGSVGIGIVGDVGQLEMDSVIGVVLGGHVERGRSYLWYE